MNQTAALNWRKEILVYSMMIMIAGLLFSRLVLSAGLFVFIPASLLHKNILRQFKDFFSSPVLWSMTILFFIPLITGLWSDDMAHWSRIMRIKLPLLLLPVCFAGLKDLSFKDWEKIAWAFLIVIFLGSCWSAYQYLQDVKTVHEGYLRSQAIVTPMKNDHVRFSLLVSIAIFTGIFILYKKIDLVKTATRVMLITVIIALVIYLHVLAVRTGLLCFYLSILIFISWLIWNKEHVVRSLAFLLVLAALPVISWFALPTFKNRIRYFNYDISFAKQDIYLPGSNDGNRIISIKAG